MNTDRVIALISEIREGANKLIAQELARRGVNGIVSSHGNILVQLYRHGPMPMSRLAELIGRKKNTLTVLVRKLDKAGYVKLGKSPGDNRVTVVELTEKGEEFRRQFQEISKVLLDRVWGDMPREQREILFAGLEKINRNLGGG
jgi:DNA-binding MarR family transcriptional regulator